MAEQSEVDYRLRRQSAIGASPPSGCGGRMSTKCLFAFLCFVSLATAAHAEEPAPPDASGPEWEFLAAPYFWGVGLEGTLSADDQSADLDVSFSDILDDLDAGFLGAFEARRGRFGLVSNLVYMKLSPDAEQSVTSRLPGAQPGSFDVRATMESLIVEVRPAWEALSLPLFGDGDPRRVALDLGPGARIWWLDNHLDVKLDPGAPVGSSDQRFDESTDWVDFVAGARVRARLTERIGLVVSGDYGGFDIGSSSHRTWSLLGLLSYRLGERWDLAAGWRTLDIDRGAIDATLEGPLLGAVYRF